MDTSNAASISCCAGMWTTSGQRRQKKVPHNSGGWMMGPCGTNILEHIPSLQQTNSPPKKKRPKPRRKCIVFQPLIFRDTLIVLETFLLFLPLFLEVGPSHHIFVKFLASENWGNWCAIIFTYPPGNESISHQTGKGRSKIIDSKVPAGMGYASSQEGML